MNILKKLLVEFLGTFIFVLVIALCLTQKVVVTPIAIGLTLTIIVYIGSKISGGYYNPAITLSVWLTNQNKINIRDTFLYMIFQLIGGIVGGLVSWGLTLNTVRFYPLTENGSDITRAFFAEFIFSSLLVFVVLVFTISKTYEGNQYFGFLIGFVNSIAPFSIGSISGAAINPAVGFGITIVNLCSTTNNNDFVFAWIYLSAPFLGGIFSNLLFCIFFSFENNDNVGGGKTIANGSKFKFNKYSKIKEIKNGNSW